MDFELSEEQIAIQDTAARFVRKELPRTKILEWVKDRVEPPRSLFRKLGEMGMYNFLMPSKYGGQDNIDPMGMLTFVEQLARASSSLTTIYGRSGVILGPLIAKFGTPEQQELVLPKVVAGEAYMSMALTESEAGSDASSLKTRAVQQLDGSWLINGSKLYCTQAGGADFLVLCARTDPDAIKQHGISLFLIEKPAANPAIECRRLDTMGMQLAPTYSLSITDLRLPAAALIGVENQGWQQMLRGLDLERLYHGAIGVGAAQGIIDDVIAHVKQREQFGKPLGKLQSVRHKIVDMQMRVEAARMFTYRGAAVLATTGHCHREASFAKISGAETFMHCAYTGQHLMGGYGYCLESGMPMHMSDAPVFEIGGGAMEIQRDILARELGL
ncbi:MAG: acyl-CoA/acyl-ACP dehydrogenase [Comamonadaceae bacterium]|nr:acyl-CoA/acyl-ACP dehydrogenase [Comamonadaceae bacterium]